MADPIAELRALLAAASPGPWSVSETSEDDGAEFHTLRQVESGPRLIASHPSAENAALIVALRNAATTLLDRVERAEAERDAARAEGAAQEREVWLTRCETRAAELDADTEWGQAGALRSLAAAIRARGTEGR